MNLLLTNREAPFASRAVFRVQIISRQTNGRPKRPPIRWFQKNRIVLSEVPGGIEPPNRDFADLCLNHLATAPFKIKIYSVLAIFSSSYISSISPSSTSGKSLVVASNLIPASRPSFTSGTSSLLC